MTTKIGPVTAALLAAMACGALPQEAAPADPALLAATRQLAQEQLELSKVAVRKAGSKKVRAFAEMMTKHEERLDRDLTTLAANYGVTEPAKISQAMQQRISAIEKLEGKEFDVDYLKMMLDLHRDHVEVLDQLAAADGDARLRDFARKAAQVERKHTKALQEVADPLLPHANSDEK